MATFWLRLFLGVQQCSCKHGIAFTVGVKSPQVGIRAEKAATPSRDKWKWYVRRESKHLSVPTTCEVECSIQCSVSDIMPNSY